MFHANRDWNMPPHPSTFTPTRSPDNARESQIWPVSLEVKVAPKEGGSTYHDHDRISSDVKVMIKGGKSTDRDHNVTSSERGTSVCKIIGRSLHAFYGKCPEKSSAGRTNRWMYRPKKGHGWSDIPSEPWTGRKRVFRASDGRTDNWKT